MLKGLTNKRGAVLRFGQRAGNVDHGKKGEYKRLYKTGEQVEVDGQHRGDTDRENRNAGQNAQRLQQGEQSQRTADDCDNQALFAAFYFRPYAKNNAYSQQHNGHQPALRGDEADHKGGQHAKCSVDDGGDHAAACNVAEVTKGHGSRLSDFTDDIHGGHDCHRLRKTLQPAHEAVVFDIVVPDDHRYHQRPDHGTAYVRCCGTKEAGQADVGAGNAAQEDGAHKRRPVCVVLAHGAGGEVVDHIHALFNQHLHAIRMGFQVLAQPDAGNAQDERDESVRNQRLRDRNTAKNGNGKVNECARYVNVHSFSPGFLKNSITIRIGRNRTRGSTMASGLHSPLLAKTKRTTNSTIRRT